MWRYAKYAIPFILKRSHQSPVKALAGLLMSYLVFILGFAFILAAAFIWIDINFGTIIACLVIGFILMIFALVFMSRLKGPKHKSHALPENVRRDPLAQHIPPSVRENPTVQKLLLQISENPVAATATAVTLGMLISNEFFEEK